MTALRRPVVVLGLLLVVTGVVATVLSLRSSEPGSSAPSGSSTTVPATDASAGGPGSQAERILQLEAQVRTDPEDWEGRAALGAAYIAQAAVTGDPTLYLRAEESIERSLDDHPNDNLPATIAQSSLAAARHDFGLALEWGERADALAPDNPSVKGVVGDALLELGRYDEAFATFQRMIDLRPDLPAYSRISYARELQGDVDGAVEAMAAAESAAAGPSDAAFAAFQLGELEWNRGEPAAAEAHYQRALQLDPDAARSSAALARASFFAGDEEEAIDAYRAVVARLPLPQYVSELADLYTVTDQPDEARDQLELLEAQGQLFADAGVAVDADLALINADNDIDLDDSLKAMEREWEKRKSIFVADALAWSLHVNGRDADALEYSDRALDLGTRNALFYFHRAEIHRALGDDEAAERDQAEAEAINPNFSILHSR